MDPSGALWRSQLISATRLSVDGRDERETLSVAPARSIRVHWTLQELEVPFEGADRRHAKHSTCFSLRTDCCSGWHGAGPCTSSVPRMAPLDQYLMASDTVSSTRHGGKSLCYPEP